MSQHAVKVAAHPEPKSGLVWLASFPKSGNTWTRVFLSNLAAIMAGEGSELALKSVARFSISCDMQIFFEEILGFKPTEREVKIIAATRCAVQQKIADRYQGLIFAKTHNALIADHGHPVINFAVTAGAVYIVRNPLDVVISLSHHSSIAIDQAIETMATVDTARIVDDKHIHELWSSWSRHVESWTRRPHPAIHVMRYEDMLADPHKSFGALARHLQLDPTPAELALAVERSSFEKLKDEEGAAGFAEKPEKAERFFREGRSGQWRDVLTPQQVQRIIGTHREQMARFGYIPAA